MDEEHHLNKSKVITASEIGQYHYCPTAWYLQRCGHQPESPYLEPGIQFHQTMGKTISCVEHQKRKHTHYLQMALFLFLLSLLMILIGVIF